MGNLKALVAFGVIVLFASVIAGAYSFGASGGELRVLSPSYVAEAQSSDGDAIAIAGKNDINNLQTNRDNQNTQPPQPYSNVGWVVWPIVAVLVIGAVAWLIFKPAPTNPHWDESYGDD